MKLSSILLITALLLVMIGSLMVFTDGFYSPQTYIIIVAMIMAGIVFMLNHPLDLWWIRRYPPPMPAKLEYIMGMNVPYYRHLNAENKERFRQRMMIMLTAKDFEGNPMKSVPEDIQALINAQLAMMTFGLKDYELTKYEKVVIYPHAFGTPNHQYLHSSETHHEDGVLIFDADRMMLGIMQSSKFLNISLYEWATAFVASHPDMDFPNLKEEDWALLTSIRGINQTAMSKFIGIADISIQAAAIEHFFVKPKEFKKLAADLYQKYVLLFNQDPLEISKSS